MRGSFNGRTCGLIGAIKFAKSQIEPHNKRSILLPRTKKKYYSGLGN